MYVIAIDIGTQGTKGGLYSQALQCICTAFEASNLISPAAGTVWQEPEELYASVLRVTAELMAKAQIAPGQVAAIGIDGQMAGILGIGPDGQAVTPYDSWLDTRCEAYVRQMAKEGREVVKWTGGPVSFTHGPKILWWKNEHPDVYKKVSKFVLPHAYVVGRLTGLSGGDAYSDYTTLHFSGFADNRNKAWAAPLLDRFGVAEAKMPRIVSPFTPIGGLTQEAAAQMGLKPGTPVAAGCGDTAASTFGAGMLHPGMVLDCAGTASVLSCITDSFEPDIAHETMTLMRSPVDGLFTPLAYLGGGGLCVRWFRDQLSGRPAASYETLEVEASTVPPGCEGLTFIPHFSGRALPNDPMLKGGFIGLDFKHKRGHMYRAVLEAVAYEYRYYLDILKTLYPACPFSQMLSIGGGAQSPLMNQIKADVLGLCVKTLSAADTALVGSAVIAGVAAGLITDYEKTLQGSIRLGREFVPEKESADAYAPCQAQYVKAVAAFSTFFNSTERSENHA